MQRKSQHAHRYETSYDFEDVDVGDNLVVNGTAELSWDYSVADPTCHTPGEFVYDIYKIIVRTKNGLTIDLDSADELFNDIEARLTDDIYDGKIRDMLIDAMEREVARDEDDYAFNDELRHDS